MAGNEQRVFLRDLMNSLARYPEVLREADRGEEAENLECIIEDIKTELCKAT